MSISAIQTSMAPNAPVQSVADETDFELVIRPRPGWINVDWKELWQFRELMYFQVWRDVKVRYKQTALGVLWAILVPVFSMVIFTMIFGNFADMKGKLPDGENYSLFVYAGLLPWTLFATALSTGGLALVNQQAMISKIYFPRLFVPAAVVGGAFVDMALSFGVMAVLMIFYRDVPTGNIVALLPLMLLLCLASLGVSFLLSALTVSYRDFRFVLPFMVQAWFYLTPVIYPVRILPAKFHWLLALLNPMSGIIDGFRSSLLHEFNPWQPTDLLLSSLSCVGLFLFGIFFFRKTERRIADVA